jgi:peptidoglycan/xylan/chitin deacetylase (PgdA/CDA1 family)
MRVAPVGVAVAVFGLSLVAAGCAGHSNVASCSKTEPRTPPPPPKVTLTADEKQVWAPLPPDRSAVPVLLYHGIGAASDFSNSSDASYGVDFPDFARQMTMIEHAGYQTIGLSTFLDFVQGKPVELPPRPLLLTFDDGRADSWTGADGILEKLHFNAVMFVDVGPVQRCDPEYLTWQELQDMQTSGRWQLQLHAGPDGHEYIRYGLRADQTGPFYAYEKPAEKFDEWQNRARSDIEEGQRTLTDEIPTFVSRTFAPPYGAYGQDGTNDPKIPGDLLGWLTEHFDAVFTQDQNARAHAGAKQPLGRIQVTRAMTDGQLHSQLLAGK